MKKLIAVVLIVFVSVGFARAADDSQTVSEAKQKQDARMKW